MSSERYSSTGRIINIKPHDEKIFAQHWQKEILMAHFDKNYYPAKEELVELEKEIKLDIKWIRNWYQYQRKRRNIRHDQHKSNDQYHDDFEASEVEDFPDNPEDEIPAKKSIKRKIYSQPWQRVILNEYYGRNPYPSKEEVEEIESKIKLDSIWIKSWFHYKRHKDKSNQTNHPKTLSPAENRKEESIERSYEKTLRPAENVTLNESTEKEESFEKSYEKPAVSADLNMTEKYEKLRKNFEELQSQYNDLAEKLLQRSIFSEQSNPSADPPKVPTVDLTEVTEAPPPVSHYPPPAVSYPPQPPQGYPYPHYYPPYYPPQYPQYSQPPQYYPQPSPQGPPTGLPPHPCPPASLPTLPYPPIPQ